MRGVSQPVGVSHPYMYGNTGAQTQAASLAEHKGSTPGGRKNYTYLKHINIQWFHWMAQSPMSVVIILEVCPSTLILCNHFGIQLDPFMLKHGFESV